MKDHVITALVEHKPGVMQRISAMFSRRKFNIDSITVGSTENKDVARMTIITRGDDAILEQILKQMNKLVPVIKVQDLNSDDSVCRELCLVKVHTPDEKHKSQVIQYADVFRGTIVDVSPKALIVEITGDSQKIGAFLDLVRVLGIKEMARTGTTAMTRG
ncbi:MAG: acetolactate synthase small subunit [Candidatus Altiarchaeota archaeon]